MFFRRIFFHVIFFHAFYFYLEHFCVAYEYCKDDRQMKLCGSQRHIYCHPEQMNEKRLKAEKSEGKFYDMFPLTNKVKRIFKEEHNNHRNDLACGKIEDNSGEKFPKATRMREVIWDDELAYLAKTHAKLCTDIPDECRNTFRIRNSGQNSAYFLRSETKAKIVPIIKEAVAKWFGESKSIKDGKAAANMYPPEATNDAFEQFTVVASDYVSRIGCAISLCEHAGTDQPYHFLVTCNYDWKNVLQLPVYKDGDNSASECDFWKNEKSNTYSCLCGNNGNMKYVAVAQDETKPTGSEGEKPGTGDGGETKPTEKPKTTKPTTTKPTTTKPTTTKPTTTKPTTTTTKPTTTTTKPTTTKPTTTTTKPTTTKPTTKPTPPGDKYDDRPTEVEYEARPQGNFSDAWCKNGAMCGLFGLKNDDNVICNPDKFRKANGKGYTLQEIYPMTTPFRRQLLALHDYHRNEIACGRVKDAEDNFFPAAARQRVLMWDWNLYWAAEKFVTQCVMAHDRCHAVGKYKIAGQNLYSDYYINNNGEKKFPNMTKQLVDTIKLAVDAFFAEAENIYSGKLVIEKFPKHKVKPGKQEGHFLQGAPDFNSRMACAISKCIKQEKKKFTTQILCACYYDSRAINGWNVYKTGAPASACKDWKANKKSTTYPCLCENTGFYKQIVG